MEIFGISGTEALVILVVAIIVLGPGKAAEALRFVSALMAKVRKASTNLREQAKEQLPQANISNLTDLDPRSIVRGVVREEMDAWMKEFSATDNQNPS